jgi:hypothetical protein
VDTAPPAFAGFVAFMPHTTCGRMVSGSLHFPSRVLCSFHSRYYCAIGLRTCLGFEVGAPEFARDFQRVLLRRPSITLPFTPTGLSPSLVPRSSGLQVRGSGGQGFATPHFHTVSRADSDCPVPSSIAFTEGISLISFPLPTKMLQSGRFPSADADAPQNGAGCPIR